MGVLWIYEMLTHIGLWRQVTLHLPFLTSNFVHLFALSKKAVTVTSTITAFFDYIAFFALICFASAGSPLRIAAPVRPNNTHISGLLIGRE